MAFAIACAQQRLTGTVLRSQVFEFEQQRLQHKAVTANATLARERRCGVQLCLEILLHVIGVLLVGVVTDFTINLSAKDEEG